MSVLAEEITVIHKPSDFPDPSTTFKLQPIDNPPTSATPGHILLRSKVISVDPYLRTLLRSCTVGDPLISYTVAEVVDSQREGYRRGDLVMGAIPWRTIQLHDGKGFHSSEPLRVLHLSPTLPLSANLGVLGMPGFTAYFGLLDPDVGNFQAGQIIIVSGAAGAVGSFVGQLAKLKGAKKVIGIAGGPDKCSLVKERYLFDECIDYKALNTTEAMTAALKAAAPGGADLYFDNVGGFITQSSIKALRHFGRVALCGAISQSNNRPEANLIPNFLGDLIYGGITMRGFFVGDYMARLDEFFTEVVPLVEEGKIRFDETVYRGFDKVPEAFAGLSKVIIQGKQWSW